MDVPMITLDMMVPGESGKIVRIHGKGPVRRRLSDMGLTQGATIEMVKPSPLGDPVEYRLRGYHLSLRKSEARTIEVELLAGSRPHQKRKRGTSSLTPLVRCNAGDDIEIVQFQGGRGILSRMQNMGLALGMVLQVVQNDFPGPMILARDNQDRFVLGKGLARHILVRLLSVEDQR